MSAVDLSPGVESRVIVRRLSSIVGGGLLECSVCVDMLVSYLLDCVEIVQIRHLAAVSQVAG